MLYPIHVNLEGKRCVIVGAGAVAGRKVQSLLDCNANIIVVAPKGTSKFQQWSQDGSVSWIIDYYREVYLEDAFLVIAATDQPDVNEMVTNDANDRQLLVCRIDQPEEGIFTSPSQMSRGDLVLTISTSGIVPLWHL